MSNDQGLDKKTGGGNTVSGNGGSVSSGRRGTARQRMVGAFWDLFKEIGIKNVTVSAITKKAGVHRSTFYEYFDDVYDLLDAVEQEFIDEISANADRVIDSLEIVTLEAYLREIALIIPQYMDRGLQLIGANGDPAMRPRLLHAMKSKLSRVSGIPADYKYLDLVAEIVFSSVFTGMSYYMDHPDRLTYEELTEILQKTMRAVVASVSPEGHTST